jgi:histidine ammonia-lyase
MGANGAVKCKRVIDNVEKVLAIELLTAIQAIEFRRPSKTSPVLENIITKFRSKVSINEADRILHDDMMASITFLKDEELLDTCY